MDDIKCWCGRTATKMAGDIWLCNDHSCKSPFINTDVIKLRNAETRIRALEACVTRLVHSTSRARFTDIEDESEYVHARTNAIAILGEGATGEGK